MENMSGSLKPNSFQPFAVPHLIWFLLSVFFMRPKASSPIIVRHSCILLPIVAYFQFHLQFFHTPVTLGAPVG